MIVRKLATSLRRQDWFTLAVELLVVIVGLFLAFQVDRWWEERDDRELEANYLDRLATEVNRDIEDLEYAIALARTRQGFVDFLIEAAENPAIAEQEPARFMAAVIQCAYTFTPSLTSHTFDDLRSTGNIGLIREAPVRAALYDYYDFDRSQRQFMSLNFMIEFRQFTLAAGVLTYAQTKRMGEDYFVVRPDQEEELRDLEVDEEAVSQAFQRFLDAPELIAWLPKVWGVQQELIWVHGRRLERARQLLQVIGSYQHSGRPVQT